MSQHVNIPTNITITGVMACDPRGVIGNKGRLPWDIPAEIDFFRSITSGRTVVMGRLTFEGLPNVAKQRMNCLVISSSMRKSRMTFPTGEAFTEALQSLPPQEIFFIGGAALAKTLLERRLVSRFLLSRIHSHYAGDTMLDLSLLNYLTPPATHFKSDEFTVCEYKSSPKDSRSWLSS